MVDIRAAEDADETAIWAMLKPVFRAGDTYAIDRDISRDDALAYWRGERAFVAEDTGEVLGTYYLKRNQKGGGAHICNCGYITARGAEGRGVARAMLAHSLAAARNAGFEAMQFNFVLADNIRAVETWTRAGFAQIGRIPRAFTRDGADFVDALILHKDLRV